MEKHIMIFEHAISFPFPPSSYNMYASQQYDFTSIVCFYLYTWLVCRLPKMKDHLSMWLSHICVHALHGHLPPQTIQSLQHWPEFNSLKKKHHIYLVAILCRPPRCHLMSYFWNHVFIVLIHLLLWAYFAFKLGFYYGFLFHISLYFIICFLI